MLVKRKLRIHNKPFEYEPTREDWLYEYDCIARDRQALLEGYIQDQDPLLQSQFNDWNPLVDSYKQNHRRR